MIQVKWQKKWEIAKILNIADTPNNVNNHNQNNDHNHNHNHNTKEEKEDDTSYLVLLLHNQREQIIPINHIRTYVPPLPSQLHIGMKIKAIWSQDGRFYPAIIQEITDEGEYKIKFEKYNEYSSVGIYDIQLMNKKDTINKDGFNTNLVKKDAKTGNLLIAEKATIPQSLWSKDDDTPTQRLNKRKKIRSIKRQHRSLKLEVESKNRANNWLKFKQKSLKKGKKKLKSTLLRGDKGTSIFDNPSSSGMTQLIETNTNMTQFKQRTHFHHLKKDPKHYKK